MGVQEQYNAAPVAVRLCQLSNTPMTQHGSILQALCQPSSVHLCCSKICLLLPSSAVHCRVLLLLGGSVPLFCTPQPCAITARRCTSTVYSGETPCCQL